MCVEEYHVTAAHETGHVREVIHGVEAHAKTSCLANLLALDRVADATDALEVRLAEDAVVEDEKGGTLNPASLSYAKVSTPCVRSSRHTRTVLAPASSCAERGGTGG